jgi:hyperosmotically inducible periplasmic protein
MKRIMIGGVLLLVGFVLGCDRGADPAGGTGDGSYTIPPAGREQRGALPPTGRDADTTAREPDNTGVNVRDRDDAALTPGDQGGSEADRETTQRIRRALMENEQLSTTARNVTIVTIDGRVTLRGTVNSEQEKQTIAALVQQAGVTDVDNQLEVTTNR